MAEVRIRKRMSGKRLAIVLTVAAVAADEPERRFRATVETSTPAADGGVALTLRPLALPFLALDRPATVTLTLDP